MAFAQRSGTGAARRPTLIGELAEAALAHKVGNKVERAYARSDLFDRRHALMDAWANYMFGEVRQHRKARSPMMTKAAHRKIYL